MISCPSVCPCMKVWPFGNDWKWRLNWHSCVCEPRRNMKQSYDKKMKIIKGKCSISCWCTDCFFESSNLIGRKSWEQQCTMTPLNLVDTGLKQRWQLQASPPIRRQTPNPSFLGSHKPSLLSVPPHMQHFPLQCNITPPLTEPRRRSGSTVHQWFEQDASKQKCSDSDLRMALLELMDLISLSVSLSPSLDLWPYIRNMWNVTKCFLTTSIYTQGETP